MAVNPFVNPQYAQAYDKSSSDFVTPMKSGTSNAQSAGDTLGFGANGTTNYYNDNPDAGWQRYVDQLGGQNSALGRYAAKHFNEVYSGFLQKGQGDPNLTWQNYLNQYAQSGQAGQSYALASPFARDPYNTPQWSGTRYLG